jgi:hypothetical protein
MMDTADCQNIEGDLWDSYSVHYYILSFGRNLFISNASTRYLIKMLQPDLEFYKVFG